MNNILPAYSSNSSSQYVLSTKTLISSKTFFKKWFPTEVENKCPIGWNIDAKILNQFWDKKIPNWSHIALFLLQVQSHGIIESCKLTEEWYAANGNWNIVHNTGKYKNDVK